MLFNSLGGRAELAVAKLAVDRAVIWFCPRPWATTECMLAQGLLAGEQAAGLRTGELRTADELAWGALGGLQRAGYTINHRISDRKQADGEARFRQGWTGAGGRPYNAGRAPPG